MATVQITYKNAGDDGVQAPAAGNSANETLTSSASSQTTTAAAQPGQVAIIRVMGSGDIRYAVGPSPTATAADPSETIPSGEKYVVKMNGGDKIAIIDA